MMKFVFVWFSIVTESVISGVSWGFKEDETKDESFISALSTIGGVTWPGFTGKSTTIEITATTTTAATIPFQFNCLKSPV